MHVLTLLALSFAHEEVLCVGRHVETQGKGEVRVDLLLHHGHHVEGVAHGVEAQDARELLEARPEMNTTTTCGQLHLIHSFPATQN